MFVCIHFHSNSNRQTKHQDNKNYKINKEYLLFSGHAIPAHNKHHLQPIKNIKFNKSKRREETKEKKIDKCVFVGFSYKLLYL